MELRGGVDYLVRLGKHTTTARRRVKKAMHAWTFCARRLGVPRDVRLIVSRQMFKDRGWWI